MDKDEKILEFIERLKLVIDFNLVEIVDYWKDDIFAIGLKRNDKLVYIAVFNHQEADDIPTKYDYDFEILIPEVYKVIKEVRGGVNESILINDLRAFLEV